MRSVNSFCTFKFLLRFKLCIVINFVQVRCLICDEQLVSFAASRALVAVMGRRQLPVHLDGSKLVFAGASLVLKCNLFLSSNGRQLLLASSAGLIV